MVLGLLVFEPVLRTPPNALFLQRRAVCFLNTLVVVLVRVCACVGVKVRRACEKGIAQLGK